MHTYLCDFRLSLSRTVTNMPAFVNPRWSGCPTNQNVNLRTTRFFSVGDQQQVGTHYFNRSVMQPRHSDNFNAEWKRRCSVWLTGAIWLHCTRDCLRLLERRNINVYTELNWYQKVFIKFTTLSKSVLHIQGGAELNEILESLFIGL